MVTPATESLGASPVCGRAVSHQRPLHHPVPVSPGQAVHGSAIAVCRVDMRVSPTLEQRFVLCFSLLWCSGSCSDQGGVGLQHVHPCTSKGHGEFGLLSQIYIVLSMVV